MKLSGGRSRRGRAGLTAIVSVCCMTGLVGSSALALGASSFSTPSTSSASSRSTEGSGISAASSLGDPLVIAGSPTEGEQLYAQERAKLDNPAAVFARERSRTEFEHLGAAQALRVAREAFPGMVNEPAGGAPKLPVGEKIVKYEARNAAAIALPDGKHGVVESLGPIATPSGHGQFTPINLALHSTGSGYAPANSYVAVQIPKHASSGVSMPSDGVSLTPVNAQRQPVGGSEGVQEGASVVYANTQTDTDTLAKPTTGGFEIDSLLRSVDSPTMLYFRVGMPAGAQLVSNAGPGGARVMLGGKAIATIAPVVAEDAEGTGVPVKMRATGNILSVDVATGSREYDYPIEVDPQAYDETLALPATSGSETETNLQSDSETDWRYHENPAGKFGSPYAAAGGFAVVTKGTIEPGEHEEFRYGAHGQASVGYIQEESSAGVSAASGTITKLEFASQQNSKEKELILAAAGQQYLNKTEAFGDLWNESEGHYQGYNNENLVRIIQTATTTKELPEEDLFWLQLNTGTLVGINQKQGPSPGFNTNEWTIGEAGGRRNVLDGTGNWLGEHNGAVAVTATDPGLGVSDVKIKDLTAGPHGEHWEYNDPVYAEHLCTGVWCNPTYQAEPGWKGTYFTYNKEMAEGSNNFELCAEDEAEMRSCADAAVKVDNTPPYGLKIASGLAEKGAELNATQHPITVEATDATSGIGAITVFVDGKEIGKPAGACSPGPCTGSGIWTIDGESLGAGEHKLTIKATDEAGNEAPAKEYTFAIRNATPVKLGPGSVDPVTGQYAMGATDVDLADAGSVSRTYLSRSLTAGAEGPLGPQWVLSTGNGQSLKLLPDGNAEVRSTAGGLTTFEMERGKFISPPGDGNLTLEAKEKEAGKGITEYLLQDPAAGITTIFTRPIGSEDTPPLYNGQFSQAEAIPGHPGGIASDSSGDVWVTDDENSRLLEFNSGGSFLHSYSSYGWESGEVNNPSGIAINQGTGNVYAADEGNNRIEEFSSGGGFIRKFSSEGSGNYGYPREPKGVAVDSSGNVWVADYGDNRIDEFNGEGKFIAMFGYGVSNKEEKFEECTNYCWSGIAGSNNGEFSKPYGITYSNGDVWVSEAGNNRVQEFTTAGVYVKKFGTSGSGNGEFSKPEGIVAESETGNLYVGDSGNNRVEEFTSGGVFVGKFGSLGSGSGQFNQPSGVAVTHGGVYVTDRENNRVELWTHSVWLPTKTESPAPGDNRAITYRSVMVEGQAITEPIEELGPIPSGVSCGKNPAEVSQAELSARLAELKTGCRALSFTYAEKTTATGEAASEWGEYNGRLAKVSVTAYNPAKGVEKMETTPIAQYSYDKQGRLRAEWDPRLEVSTACGKTCSALKTTYGYDSEGHVTSVTAPGQQPWAFTYGTIVGDSSTGRLLKVTQAQPKASESESEVKAKLKEEQETPKLTEAPHLSGSPIVEITLGVSKGTWSHSPAVYGYQWERCNTKGTECVPIEGATNPNYKLTSKDAGHTVEALVTATNGDASIVTSSGVSGEVIEESQALLEQQRLRKEVSEGTHYSPEPGSTVEYKVPLSGEGAPHQMTRAEMAKWGQKKDLPEEATAIFPPDEPQGWPASDYKRAAIGYMDPQAREVDATTPSGAISTVEYNSLNEVTRTLSAGDRAIAMKETCESEAKCKSAEVAEKLDSENKYNGETQTEKEQEEKEVSEKKKAALEPGARLLEKLGPEHKVRLSSGTEEETRDRQKLSYNEGAPSGETYNLVTKEVEQVESASKKIVEQREKLSNYGGQNNEGWKLRKPTVVTEEPVKGRPIVKTTTYEPTTGNPLETFASVSIDAPVHAAQFGSSGSGNGKFKSPAGAALDASGDVWVVDRGNNRVEELSQTGQFIAAYGAEGVGAGQFDDPNGIAVNQSTGNVYVADSGNNRIEELSSAGKFVATFGFGVSNGKAEFETCTSSCQAGIAGAGNGQFNLPTGIAVDASGNVWVADHSNGRIEKFSSSGGFLAAYGSSGSGEMQFKEPEYLALSGGNVYVTDYGNHRVEELSSAGKFVATFGFGVSNGKAEFEICTSHCQAGISGSGNGQFANPAGIAANPSTGALYIGDSGNNRVEQFSQAGIYVTQFGTSGSGAGQFEEPHGIAASSANQIYVVDTGNSRVQMWEQVPSAPVYSGQFGTTGSESEKLTAPAGGAVDAHGNIWVTTGWSHVDEFSSSGAFVKSYGSSGVGVNQFKTPEGVGINKSTGNIYIADGANDRVDELNEKGAFVRAFGWGVSNGESKSEICTSTCQAGIAGGGAGQFNGPEGVAIDSSGNVWVVDYANNRVDEFNEKGEFSKTIGWGVSNEKEELETCEKECHAGKVGTGNGQFSGAGFDVFSGGYLYVTDVGNGRVEEFSATGAYVSQFGSKGSGNGQFSYPGGISADAYGNIYVADYGNNRVQELTSSGTFIVAFGDKGSGNSQLSAPEALAISASGGVYVMDTGNNRVQEWTPAPSPGNEGAGNSRTIYYTQAANSEYPGCGGHPEWANLVCQTEPTVQPGDSGPPPLPVTTTTYNMWNEPETITEKIGSVTRTTKKKYDSAGREVESEETSTSSEDKALPAVTEEYSSETGALVKQSSTIEGKARTTTSAFNTLGQLTSYTDAEGATTKYAYDIDGRVEEVTEPKGKQIYAYDPTTGFLTKLQDSAAGTFTATYGVAGELLTVGYPNGMAAKYTYNTIGQTTNLEYEKTTDCKEKCVWFSDAEAFGPKGELAYQSSTLSTENYSYNELGQLTQTQETPVGGKGCVTRLYGYGEESGERTSLTTREPNAKGECTSEGGVAEGHFYDAVGRLLDPGVTYDALGNMTKVPALDAGGQAIASSFYVDNQVATQEQNEKSIAYTYDPSGRTMTAKTTTKSGSTTAISHYAGPGEALTWICEEVGECKEEKETKWTRDIPGIDGALDAVQTNGGTPELELHDLQGNVIATASLSETATELLSKHHVTEFGVPTEGKTSPKYAWLGAEGATSELGTGVITQAGATYVPQLARTLQTEQVIPPGAAPNGVMDTTVYVPPELSWANESGNIAASQTVAEQRALECETNPEADPECGAYAEDPIVHLKAYQAKEIYKAIKDDLKGITGDEEYESEKSIVDWLISTTIADAFDITGGIFGAVSLGAAKHWFEELGEYLEACVRILQEEHDSHGGCRVEYGGLLGTKIPWFFDKPIVSQCEHGEANSKAVDGLALSWCYLLEKVNWNNVT